MIHITVGRHFAVNEEEEGRGHLLQSQKRSSPIRKVSVNRK